MSVVIAYMSVDKKERENDFYFLVYVMMQRYIQQHNEVELSALGMGRF